MNQAKFSEKFKWHQVISCFIVEMTLFFISIVFNFLILIFFKRTETINLSNNVNYNLKWHQVEMTLLL